MAAPDRTPASGVVLRPLGAPLPLGFLALAAASLMVSGLELKWIAQAERTKLGLILIVFPVVLQLIASVLSFLSRDGAAGSAIGLLAGTWFAIGIVYANSKPGSTSGALGLLLLVVAGGLLLSAAATGLSKVVPATVIGLIGVRFALVGIYELSAVEGWRNAAGIVGLVVTALALYAAFAMEIEDAEGRTLAPLLRRGSGERALAGAFAAQVDGVEHEAGVRKRL